MGAVDFGIIVDGAVILVEHVFGQLPPATTTSDMTPTQRIDTIYDAAREVARPTLFSLLIIIAAYLPIFALQRVEGRIFAPMANTVVSALVGALLVSFTLTARCYATARRRSPPGYPVGEVVLLRVATHIGERQDRDRRQKPGAAAPRDGLCRRGLSAWRPLRRGTSDLPHRADEPDALARQGARISPCSAPLSPMAIRAAPFTRLLIVASETMRPCQTASSRSSRLTTRSRASIRNFSTSKTCGSTATSSPPRAVPVGRHQERSFEPVDQRPDRCWAVLL